MLRHNQQLQVYDHEDHREGCEACLPEGCSLVHSICQVGRKHSGWHHPGQDAVQRSKEHPLHEDTTVEVFSVVTRFVQPRRPQSLLVGVVVVEDQQGYGRHRGQGVVEDVQPLRERQPSLEVRSVGVDHVAPAEDHALVDEEAEERRYSPVRLPTVAKDKVPQKPELGDGHVARLHGSGPLPPPDAHADVGALDHRHVVRPVAYGERDGAGVLPPHELHELPLLHGREPAADAAAAALGEVVQRLLRTLAGENLRYGSAVYHHAPQRRRRGSRVATLRQPFDRVLRGGRTHGRVQLHALLEELARLCNLYGSLYLVTGQHPDADAGLAQRGHGLRNAVLQTILQGRHAAEGQAHLSLRRDGGDALRPAVHGGARLVPLPPPSRVGAGVHDPLRHDERPQAAPGKVRERPPRGG
mmetsp:Transcript_123244/g.359851  ORF Transcript_123244/g.359851 Transcript_123244/m.359851 type:complete len:413 (+) Transcript_123244:403-1641(+)